jgi:hypothetical protein
MKSYEKIIGINKRYVGFDRHYLLILNTLSNNIFSRQIYNGQTTDILVAPLHGLYTYKSHVIEVIINKHAISDVWYYNGDICSLHDLLYKNVMLNRYIKLIQLKSKI